ncbi:MAG: AI-2E family transporter [Bacteroidia bacterium]
MELNQPIPFYARFALILLMLCLVVFILYIGNSVIMPLILAMLFAILLRPLVAFLNKRLHFPHVIAVLIAVITFVIFVGSVIWFISWHVSDFMDDLPKIRHNLDIHIGHIKAWITHKFNISPLKMERYIQSAAQDSLKSGNQLVGDTIASFSETFLTVVLIPIYTFLILLYRTLFIKFLHKLVHKNYHSNMVDIVLKIKEVIQNYIVGLLIEMGIVAVLTSTGFMLIGVPYAILLGVIGAVLNLVPYIGSLCAGLIAIIAALINSSELSSVIGVVVVNITVQLIDNNFLVPRIVASKVKINALVSIVAVFIGGMLAGVIGMFLAIPVVAILKVIFDRVDDLRPWGYLMGAELPKTYEWRKLRLPDLNAGMEESKEEEATHNKNIEKKE